MSSAGFRINPENDKPRCIEMQNDYSGKILKESSILAEESRFKTGLMKIQGIRSCFNMIRCHSNIQPLLKFGRRRK
jgi:hypothetical protein